MTWMKLETIVRSNPKVGATVAITGHCDAAWLWLAGNMYCRDALTDGFIADFVLPTLVPALPLKVLKPLPGHLVTAGLWYREDGGYRVHDFLNHNPTKAEVEAKRKADNDRKKGGVMFDSVRNPKGIQPPSVSHAGAGADSPSSTTSSLDLSFTEESSRETTQPPRVPRGRQGLIDSPGRWGVEHAQCVEGFCAFVCLRRSVFTEFINRAVSAGFSEADAQRQTLAWAQAVKTRWAESREIPGANIFDFWRNEWATSHKANKPATSTASGDPLAGIREAERRG